MSPILVLLAVNLAVFWYELALARPLGPFLDRWGLVPAEIVQALSGDSSRLGVLVTPLTAMFIHATWPHLLMNLIYLWFFGRLAEGALGPARCMFIYFVAGGAAALAHVAALPASTSPAVGASGAIAGLIGCYLPLRFNAEATPIEGRGSALLAGLLIVLWLASLSLGGVLQVVQGAGVTTPFSWWGHVAGFITGLILVSFSRFAR